MKPRAFAVLAFFTLILILGVTPACSSGAAEASLAMPVRGVWMHPGLFGPDKEAAVEKMRTTLDEYAKAGINTLIMLVKNTSGHVYYASEIGVPDGAYHWDFFGVFLEEAKKRKMEVHPWFCVFPESALLGEVRQHPEWLIASPKREMVGAVNPALPAARDYEIRLMLEVVKKYDVGWVHLDYVRYPCEPTEPFFSFDAETLRLFKADTGIDMSAVKARDTGNPAWNVWLRWNTDRVTVFLRELKDALKATGRKVKVSAAVFPDAVNARVMIGQDWAVLGPRRPRRHAQPHALHERRQALREARPRGRRLRQGEDARLPRDRHRHLPQPEHARGDDRADEDQQGPQGRRGGLFLVERA